MISIRLKQTVAAPALAVRDCLLQHEQLGRFFNARFRLKQPQDAGEIVGGKGAIRQVSMSGSTFDERIVSADEHHICYQIVGNKPVADHKGTIYFHEAESTASTEITYKIVCSGPWWLPDFVLSHVISKDISNALVKLASFFEQESV